ncbi:MAG: hypothetical protein HQK83_13355 [Fibrobacteria bacterium]|nr:hypothetical protein [Fibrobacteria bacterium]
MHCKGSLNCVSGMLSCACTGPYLIKPRVMLFLKGLCPFEPVLENGGRRQFCYFCAPLPCPPYRNGLREGGLLRSPAGQPMLRILALSGHPWPPSVVIDKSRVVSRFKKEEIDHYPINSNQDEPLSQLNNMYQKK